MYVEKDLMTNEACRKTNNGNEVTDDMLCAGEKGIDACQVHLIIKTWIERSSWDEDSERSQKSHEPRADASFLMFLAWQTLNN